MSNKPNQLEDMLTNFEEGDWDKIEEFFFNKMNKLKQNCRYQICSKRKKWAIVVYTWIKDWFAEFTISEDKSLYVGTQIRIPKIYIRYYSFIKIEYVNKKK